MTVNKNEAGTLLPQAFTFNASNQQIRTIILDGEPYFVVKDVCDVLGHTNPSVAIQMLDDDERTKKSLGRPALRRTGRYELPSVRKRESIRYPRRGEQITADILHLLWLIGESLHQGDQIAVALELGVSRQTVSRVLNGGQKSSRILMALYKRAQANREADRLYCSPREMAQLLTSESATLPAPLRLPAVHFNRGSGGSLGNQNARKHRSDR